MIAPAVSRARCYSVRLRDEARRAAAALDSAMCFFESMVTAHQVITRSAVNGEPLPKGYRLGRVLEPLIDDGAVEIRRSGTLVLYGLTGHRFLVLPGMQQRSNLARVEAALKKAIQQTNSAVTPERVEAVLAEDDQLALDNDAQPVSHYLHSLCACDRARRVRPSYALGRRWYFTTPEGASTVRSTEHTDLDRRRRAICKLWEKSGGRPFTTAVVRRFAAADKSLRIEDDVRTGWPNALQHLEAVGEIVGVRVPGSRWVRWAVASEWSALGEREREDRLRDYYRLTGNQNVVTTSECLSNAVGLAAGAPVYDVAAVSRNANIRAVIQIARATALANEQSATVREVWVRRPLTRREIIAASPYCTHLLGTESLTQVLSGASRRRRGFVSTAIHSYGSVGGTTYFDVEKTEAGELLLIGLRAAEELDVIQRADCVGRLLNAETLSMGGRVAVHPRMLYARAEALVGRLTELIAALHCALKGAPLLPKEAVRIRDCDSFGGIALAQMQGVMARQHDASILSVDVGDVGYGFQDTIEVDVAAGHVEAISGYRISNPQEFSARLPASGFGADLLKWNKGAGRQQAIGRRRQRAIDRVGFSVYAALRWGGPAWTSLAAAAVHALGELRSSELICAILSSNVPVAYHPGLLASLALLDDARSRAAIREYLEAALEAEQAGEPLTPLHVLTAGALGLARKHVGGLADSLAPEERRVLQSLVEWRRDDMAARVAARALASWSSAEASLRCFSA